MVVWVGDGNIRAFDPAQGALDIDMGSLIAPNSTVDSQFITRIQWASAVGGADQVVARATFNYDGTESGPVVPVGTDWTRWATMFIARSSDFPGPGETIPTAAQMLAVGPTLRVYRGVKVSGSTADVATFLFYGPDNGTLSANTKYWVLIMPTWVRKNVTPRYNTDVPLTGYPANSIGRVVSFWTNRTPGKPTITTPANGSVHAAASTISLAWTRPDADAYVGDPSAEYTDIIGGQVQYAAQPTADNPTPEWTNLIYKGAGGVVGESWFIADTTDVRSQDEDAAMGTTTIIAGENAPTTNETATLPSGNWQLRVRTFDQGNPCFNVGGPIYGTSPNSYTPDTYPATNASPWSNPINISIPTQVPPPLTISPKDRRAYAEGTEITLKWKYRNTSALLGATTLTSTVTAGTYTTLPVAAVPAGGWPQYLKVRLANGQIARLSAAATAAATSISVYSIDITSSLASGSAVKAYGFPQVNNQIQIRRTGDAWFDLSTPAGDYEEFVVDQMVFPLVSNNQYEWRVSSEDSDGEFSQYSETAYFWIVSAPASGASRPLPEEAIEGATLGCGTHEAFIYRRGGTTRVGKINGISNLDWSRKRDDMSDAKIVVSDWDIDCGALLADLHCWAYELVIFRYNGLSRDRVWEGPITLITYKEDEVEINAKDVMAYAYRRILKQIMDDSSNDSASTVVDRAMRVLQNALASDDPNILAYLVTLISDDDTPQSRNTAAYSRTAFEEVDDMAANGGLDYTALGRAILLWGTKNKIGVLPEFRDEDLGASPIVSEYGMNMANRYAITNGSGVFGEATRLDADGNDPIYGLVEMLSTTTTEDAQAEAGTVTTVVEAAKLKASYEMYSERAIADRYPNPVVVRIPDNTTVNPSAVISIQQLVPGVIIPLRSTKTLRKVLGFQKLDSVKVVESSGNEIISITLSPFGGDESVTTGEEG